MKFMRRNMKRILGILFIGLALMGISALLSILGIISRDSTIYLGIWDLGAILFAVPFCFIVVMCLFYVRDLIYIRLTGKDYIDFNLDITGKILSPPEKNKKK